MWQPKEFSATSCEHKLNIAHLPQCQKLHSSDSSAFICFLLSRLLVRSLSARLSQGIITYLAVSSSSHNTVFLAATRRSLAHQEVTHVKAKWSRVQLKEHVCMRL